MIADPDRGTRGVLGLANGPDMYEAPPGGHKDHQRGETAPLQAARRANADQLPEQHAEVEAREVNQEALQDIAMPRLSEVVQDHGGEVLLRTVEDERAVGVAACPPSRYGLGNGL